MNGFPVLDDFADNDLLFPPSHGRGLDTGAPGYGSVAGYAGVAEPFPAELLIPESEWQARIEEQDARRASPWHLAYERGPVTIKDQGQLPYCWIFATTTDLEIVRAAHNLPHVELSPASAGSWITGFRRRGGFGREAIEGLGETGAVPVSEWPQAAVDRRFDTAENRALAARYKAAEWYYVESWPQAVSCLLRGLPVSAGYNWWAHQVCLVRLGVIDGEVCPLLANSWSPAWGEKGFGWLQGRRKYPDDAVACRAALPS